MPTDAPGAKPTQLGLLPTISASIADTVAKLRVDLRPPAFALVAGARDIWVCLDLVSRRQRRGEGRTDQMVGSSRGPSRARRGVSTILTACVSSISDTGLCG